MFKSFYVCEDFFESYAFSIMLRYFSFLPDFVHSVSFVFRLFRIPGVKRHERGASYVPVVLRLEPRNIERGEGGRRLSISALVVVPQANFLKAGAKRCFRSF